MTSARPRCYSYEYFHPAVTVDCVVFALDGGVDLRVLLIERGEKPFVGSWALPGGFVQEAESLEDAALRELKEETGVDKIYLEQLHSFGEPKRDPRERVISVAYYALVNLSRYHLVAATDARSAAWFQLAELPSLAFDHNEIIEVAYQRLKSKICYQPIGFELLPEKFTLSQLQRLYEGVLERSFDKRNFRKKMLKMDLLVELDEVETDVAYRAARLYSFDQVKYRQMQKNGLEFRV